MLFTVNPVADITLGFSQSMFALDSDDVRFLLWFALGLASTLSFLSEFSTFSTSLLVLVLLALAISLATYPQDLRSRYEVVTANFHKYTGKRAIGHPFLFWINLLFVVLMSCIFIWHAYTLAAGFSAPRKWLLRAIYEIFGANSYILFVTSLGTYFVGLGIEVFIGSRIKREGET